MKLLLGSASPRRKALLSDLGFPFEIVHIDCAEDYPSNILPKNIAAYLSEKKSLAFRALLDKETLITADTIVFCENQILGKPTDYDDAANMLKMISGKKHIVYTAITVRNNKKTITETDKSVIYFDEISDDEIFHYLNHFSFDKAGSYGIQDWIGLAKIIRLEGNYYAVMGLPTARIYRILKNMIS